MVAAYSVGLLLFDTRLIASSIGIIIALYHLRFFDSIFKVILEQELSYELSLPVKILSLKLVLFFPKENSSEKIDGEDFFLENARTRQKQIIEGNEVVKIDVEVSNRTAEEKEKNDQFAAALEKFEDLKNVFSAVRRRHSLGSPAIAVDKSECNFQESERSFRKPSKSLKKKRNSLNLNLNSGSSMKKKITELPRNFLSISPILDFIISIFVMLYSMRGTVVIKNLVVSSPRKELDSRWTVENIVVADTIKVTFNFFRSLFYFLFSSTNLIVFDNAFIDGLTINVEGYDEKLNENISTEVNEKEIYKNIISEASAIFKTSRNGDMNTIFNVFSSIHDNAKSNALIHAEMKKKEFEKSKSEIIFNVSLFGKNIQSENELLDAVMIPGENTPRGAVNEILTDSQFPIDDDNKSGDGIDMSTVNCSTNEPLSSCNYSLTDAKSGERKTDINKINKGENKRGGLCCKDEDSSDHAKCNVNLITCAGNKNDDAINTIITSSSSSTTCDTDSKVSIAESEEERNAVEENTGGSKKEIVKSSGLFTSLISQAKEKFNNDLTKYKQVDAYFQDAATTIKSKIKTRIIEWRNDVNHFQEEVSEIGLLAAARKSIDVAVQKTKLNVEEAVKMKILEAHQSVNGPEPDPSPRDVRVIGNNCIMRNIKVTMKNVLPVQLRHFEEKSLGVKKLYFNVTNKNKYFSDLKNEYDMHENDEGGHSMRTRSASSSSSSTTRDNSMNSSCYQTGQSTPLNPHTHVKNTYSTYSPSGVRTPTKGSIRTSHKSVPSDISPVRGRTDGQNDNNSPVSGKWEVRYNRGDKRAFFGVSDGERWRERKNSKGDDGDDGADESGGDYANDDYDDEDDRKGEGSESTVDGTNEDEDNTGDEEEDEDEEGDEGEGGTWNDRLSSRLRDSPRDHFLDNVEDEMGDSQWIKGSEKERKKDACAEKRKEKNGEGYGGIEGEIYGEGRSKDDEEEVRRSRIGINNIKIESNTKRFHQNDNTNDMRHDSKEIKETEYGTGDNLKKDLTTLGQQKENRGLDKSKESCDSNISLEDADTKVELSVCVTREDNIIAESNIDNLSGTCVADEHQKSKDLNNRKSKIDSDHLTKESDLFFQEWKMNSEMKNNELDAMTCSNSFDGERPIENSIMDIWTTHLSSPDFTSLENQSNSKTMSRSNVDADDKNNNNHHRKKNDTNNNNRKKNDNNIDCTTYDIYSDGTRSKILAYRFERVLLVEVFKENAARLIQDLLNPAWLGEEIIKKAAANKQ